MPKFVELVNNGTRVRYVGDAPELPPSFPPNLIVLDISQYTGSVYEGMRYATGSFVVDNTPFYPDAPVDLSLLKTNLIYKINEDAGQVRTLITTFTPGQEMTYVEKGLEAQRYLADPLPTGSNYPWLQREADATGMTLAQVATLVWQTKLMWTEAGSRIEAVRRGASVAITAATTPELANQAYLTGSAQFNQLRNLL